MEAITFDVTGMSCGGCENNVMAAVRLIDGVTDVSADHQAGTVRVAGRFDTEHVRLAIAEAGYSVA